MKIAKMAFGIAIIIYEKNKKIKGICTGTSKYHELLSIIPKPENFWEFDLLYPANLTTEKINPPKNVWETALKTAIPYVLTHNKQQLSKADFQKRNLEGKDFSNAKMWYANLKGSFCKNTNFEGVDLRYANLESINAIEANFSNSIMIDVNTKNGNFKKAKMDYIVKNPGESNILLKVGQESEEMKRYKKRVEKAHKLLEKEKELKETGKEILELSKELNWGKTLKTNYK